MILSPQELKEVYQGLVLQMGHPDPIGYMTRAFLSSGGDTEYFGTDGKMGFMPVEPERVVNMVGNVDISSLQGNVVATLTMDMMYFEAYQTITDMIVAFHYGEQAISDDGNYTGEIKKFLDEVDGARSAMRDIVAPPRATVRDVMNMMKAQLTGMNKADKLTMDVMNLILEER